MMDEARRKAELKKEKKTNRIFAYAAKMSGIGVGLFLLAFIGPLISDAESGTGLQDLFMKYGLIMMGYTAIMIVTFLFIRKYIFFMHSLMQWLILPGVAVMFVFEAYEILTG